jgi:hypothetical protein
MHRERGFQHARHLVVGEQLDRLISKSPNQINILRRTQMQTSELAGHASTGGGNRHRIHALAPGEKTSAGQRHCAACAADGVSSRRSVGIGEDEKGDRVMIPAFLILILVLFGMVVIAPIVLVLYLIHLVV